MSQTGPLLSFLDRAITSWHTAAILIEQLSQKGFVLLNEQEKWKLEKGKRYLVKRGGTVLAFIVPEKTPKQARLLTAHSDSPALKLKPNPLFTSSNYLQLATEVYGSPMLSSWVNRDLKIAGRAFVQTRGGQTEEKLLSLDHAPLFIPQLAIHFDKEVNDKGLVLNKQDHLNAIFGLQNATTWDDLLRSSLDVKKVLSYDLFLVSAEKAALMGLHQEMIASPRLDNQLSTHALLTSVMEQDKALSETVSIACFFDHEEIGSMSQEGAYSSFLSETLSRLLFCWGLDQEEQLLFRGKSFCLSVDGAHAFNPNYDKKYDPRHSPLFTKGVVFKCDAVQKYASTAASLAPLVALCQAQDIPYQYFSARSDTTSGTTVGPIMAHRLGIATADIGAPLLSMHSIREVCSVKDYFDLVTLLSHFMKAE